MLNEEQAWVFTGALFVVVLLMLAMHSRWHFLQGSIFMAVVASNIHWQWTEPLVAVLFGVGIAYGTTAGLLWLVEHAKRRRQLRASEHRRDQSAASMLGHRPGRQGSAR
jgi:uncharacterized membrane protein YciS (DUF1049 family)